MQIQRLAGNRATSLVLAGGGGPTGSGRSGVIQRWPFNLFGKGRNKSSDESTSGDIEISSSRQGWDPSKTTEGETKQAIGKHAFLRDPRRRRAFLAWIVQEPGFETTTENDLVVDAALAAASTGGARPSFEEGRAMLKALQSATGPEARRVIAWSVEEYAKFGEVARLEDNFVDEARFYKRPGGGLAQVGGIGGKMHYRFLSAYDRFSSTPAYREAMSADAGPPPVPPRQRDGARPAPPPRGGRRELGSVAEAEPAEVGGGAGGRVAGLAGQLGGVIGATRGGARRPAPPPPSRQQLEALAPSGAGPAGPPPPGPTRERIALEDRTDPRRTERAVLAALSAGTPVPAPLLKQLAQKMGKGQTHNRGRDVTDSTEAEYAAIVAKLGKDDLRTLQSAIKDYTNTSNAINAQARGGQLAGTDPKVIANNIDMLDQMFDIQDQHGFTDRQRVTYRLATYQPAQRIPFGSTIAVGDLIGDKAYFSTSENRQFLQTDRKPRSKGVRYVKMTVLGSGGANISGGGTYTNAANKEMKEMWGKKFKGPVEAGQAEILFRRNSVFRVERIGVEGEDVHVVVTRVTATEAGDAKVKNAFDGGPFSVS